MITEPIRMAMAFEDAMTKLVTATGGDRHDLKALRKQVLDCARTTGQSAVQVAEDLAEAITVNPPPKPSAAVQAVLDAAHDPVKIPGRIEHVHVQQLHWKDEAALRWAWGGHQRFGEIR